MKLIDLTGQRFGRWSVIERSQTSKKWICKCDCGTIKEVTGATLRRRESTSCGCYRKEAVSKCQQEDLTGRKFGHLTVVELNRIASNRQCVWKCLCECGNYTDVFASNLKRNHTTSCGCIGASVNENEIANILTNMNINYEREFSFDDLVSPSGYKLYFDFAIKDSDGNVAGLIEYQGEQHEKVMPNDPHFGEFQRAFSDNAKKVYCKNNHIPLFEIWYYEPSLSSATQKIVREILTMSTPCQVRESEKV